MRWVRQFRLFLQSLFRKRAADGDFDEELQFHVQNQIDEYAAQGLDPEQARHAALRSFGAVEQLKEECRDMRGTIFVENVLKDLRFGCRMLRRNPGFSALAILCLTIGIGANAAVFSWIEGVLFRPYPAIAHQDRLMVLAGTSRGKPDYEDVSWPDFRDLQRSCTLFDAFIAEKIVGATLSIGDRAERAVGSIVSANYFNALGVRPILGRGFEPSEDYGRNAHPVVVISYQFWKNRFHGDSTVIGKTERLNGVPHTIIGVAPPGFFGTFVGYAWQFWVPASMQETFDSSGYKLEDRGAGWIEGFVQLKPGVTAMQAQQEISAVATRLENHFPATDRGRGIKLVPLWQGSPFNAAGSLSPTLVIALGVVFLVLLIACANVGNLLLVRSFARRQEMTVRLAIGAARGRLLRQLLTEGLLLSAFACAAGLLVAYWFRNGLVLIVPWRSAPVYLAGQLDWRVLAFSAGVCVGSTLLFGLVPALQTSDLNLVSALKSESGSVAGARSKTWARSGLVLVQISLSFVLLVGAGLILRTQHKIRTATPGFSTQNLLLTPINLSVAGYDQQRARNFQDELLDRMQAIEGLESVAYARVPPFSFVEYSTTPVVVDGYKPPPDQQPTVEYNEVSPGYFSIMGIPLASGREFTRADNASASLVAIVNETMVAKYWGGADPIGKRLQVQGRWALVVGVAKDAKYRDILETPTPFFYVPLRQTFSRQVTLLLRTPQNPANVAAVVAREMHALDPDLVPYQVITMSEQIERSTSAQRVAASLLGSFAVVALLLATIGLYGVMSYAVSQSTRELGLRMALGATPSQLVKLVLADGLALILGGVLLGAIAALLLTRLMGYLLYGVSPRDPLSFALAFTVMTLASLVACFIPASRAAGTEPLTALRH